jgi:hypothetical protein
VPSAKIVREFSGRAVHGPGFDAPIVPLNRPDKVQQFASTHWIVQDIAVRSEPICSNGGEQALGQAMHRHYTAPRHATREFRPVSSEKALAYLRMDAIGPDNAVGMHLLPSVESNMHLVVRLLGGGAPSAKFDRVRL